MSAKNRSPKTRGLLPALFVFLGTALFIGGCSDDNPAEPDNEDCSHFDADGLVLEAKNDVLVTQWEGTIDGEVHLDEGASLDVSVTFLTPDSSRAVPGTGCEEQFLDVLVDDETVAAVSTTDADGRWSFRITGVEEGETSITVRILHVDHPDFTSLDLPVHVGHEGEVEIEGFEIRSGDMVLVSQDEGILTGELEVAPSETLGPLQVVFIGHEGKVVEPEEGATLDWTVGDLSIVTATPDGTDPYAFSIDGVAEGETAISFDLLHKAHTDFESQGIPVRVQGSPSPEAALIREGLNPVAFWNYHPEEGPDEVQGGVVLDIGGPSDVLTVGWLGAYDESQINDKRPEMVLADADFVMTWQMSDGGVASAAPVDGAPWSVELSARSVGTTDLTLELSRGGTTVLEAGPFPVAVVDPPSKSIQDHYLNFGGAWTVIVIGEQLVSSGCDRSANPGFIDLDVGETSALYKITLLDDECTKIQLDPSYEYRFEIEDPSLVRILQTPIHWGEEQVFHLEGIAAGTTTVSVYLFQDGNFLWKSPAYPVQVIAG